MQIVTILGATGSVGRSTIDVLRQHADRFSVGSVVGGSNAVALAQLAKSCGATFAALADECHGAELKAELSGSGIASGAGEAAILDAVERDANIVFAAISGAAGLRPTHAALKPGRKIALANKETLVCAGRVFMAAAKRIGVTILPVDSEHNALQQALGAGTIDDVVTLILTASGGPFRTWSKERIRSATPAEASAHPTYAMGAKINIDSASLMNKGLELIEAHHLFGVGDDRLDVVVHPQSIIHGLVEWRDGALTAGLATPDMRIPIAHCLGAGGRLATAARRLDLAAIERLTFERPDEERFPCLALAKTALRHGGAMPTVLNAANEVAVAAFIGAEIGFLDIPRIVTAACENFASRHWQAPSCIDEALAMDEEVRRQTKTRLAA